MKKLYSYTNNRQIWRILPTDSGKLIIEDRDLNSKEVFFNCLSAESGKALFENFQLDEKYWIGIEAVHNDIIFFHKFIQPEMPQHVDIIAFDIKSQKILWDNKGISFLFIKDDKIYAYKAIFEGRDFFIIDLKTGRVNEIKITPDEINFLHKESLESKSYEDYIFPQPYFGDEVLSVEIKNIFTMKKEESAIAGKIDYAVFGEALFFNCHIVQDDGTLNNIFFVFDIEKGKYIFEIILNEKIKSFIPESFFIKNNLLFLLKGKQELFIYKLI